MIKELMFEIIMESSSSLFWGEEMGERAFNWQGWPE